LENVSVHHSACIVQKEFSRKNVREKIIDEIWP
jgi:hypothetical protein